MIFLFCEIRSEAFLKIVFSRGLFSMRLQCSMTMCLSFFIAGWYVVTKGNSLSNVFCFCFLRADCLESKVTSDRDLSIYFCGYQRSSRRRLKFARPRLFKCCFWRVCSKQSYCFAFDRASFYARRVARAKMGILKGFHRLVVSFDV